MGYVIIFQVLKLFQVVCFNGNSMVFRHPVLVPDTASVKGFCIISAPVPVPDTASVNTALVLTDPDIQNSLHINGHIVYLRR